MHSRTRGMRYRHPQCCTGDRCGPLTPRMCPCTAPNPHFPFQFFFGFWNLLCGFLIPASAIPGWWIWCYWMNPIAYTLYGLIVTQLGDLTTSIEYNNEMQLVPQVRACMCVWRGSVWLRGA